MKASILASACLLLVVTRAAAAPLRWNRDSGDTSNSVDGGSDNTPDGNLTSTLDNQSLTTPAAFSTLTSTDISATPTTMSVPVSASPIATSSVQANSPVTPSVPAPPSPTTTTTQSPVQPGNGAGQQPSPVPTANSIAPLTTTTPAPQASRFSLFRSVLNQQNPSNVAPSANIAPTPTTSSGSPSAVNNGIPSLNSTSSTGKTTNDAAIPSSPSAGGPNGPANAVNSSGSGNFMSENIAWIATLCAVAAVGVAIIIFKKYRKRPAEQEPLSELGATQTIVPAKNVEQAYFPASAPVLFPSALSNDPSRTASHSRAGSNVSFTIPPPPKTPPPFLVY